MKTALDYLREQEVEKTDEVEIHTKKKKNRITSDDDEDDDGEDYDVKDDNVTSPETEDAKQNYNFIYRQLEIAEDDPNLKRLGFDQRHRALMENLQNPLNFNQKAVEAYVVENTEPAENKEAMMALVQEIREYETNINEAIERFKTEVNDAVKRFPPRTFSSFERQVWDLEFSFDNHNIEYVYAKQQNDEPTGVRHSRRIITEDELNANKRQRLQAEAALIAHFKRLGLDAGY
jgi:hypothetical protein